ncbi:MAG TPA: twin-arginine translocation signal domain-containing protein, partial [Terriglobales bacterium]
MLIRKPSDIRPSEITGKSAYLDRRTFLTGAAALAAAAALPKIALANEKIPNLGKSGFSTSEKQTPYKDITNYN